MTKNFTLIFFTLLIVAVLLAGFSSYKLKDRLNNLDAQLNNLDVQIEEMEKMLGEMSN